MINLEHKGNINTDTLFVLSGLTAETISVTGLTADTISATTYLNIPYYSAVTKSVMDTLISNNELEVGKFYMITDADPNLYSGGTSIILQAISYSGLSLQGHGIFYTPPYDKNVAGYNVWTSGVIYVTVSGTPTVDFGGIVYQDSTDGIGSGFSAYITTDSNNTSVVLNRVVNYGYDYQEGNTITINGSQISGTNITDDIVFTVQNVITTATTYSIGDKVIWGGYVWENKNGNFGISSDSFTLDSTEWDFIPYNTTGYNISVDVIHYDYENDSIIYRKDKNNNIVSVSYDYITGTTNQPYGLTYLHPIRSFQWGNDYESNLYLGIGLNNIQNSLFECINFRGNPCAVNNINNSNIFGNIFESSEFNANNLFGCTIFSNILNNSSSISSNNLSNGNLFYNTLIKCSNINGNNGYLLNINYNVLNSDDCQSGNSIISNNDGSNSDIVYNNLTDSYISDNELKNSTIQYNSLSGFCGINNNIIKGGLISNNYLTTISVIENNNIFSFKINQFYSVLNGTFDGFGMVFNNLFNSTFDFSNTPILDSSNGIGYLYQIDAKNALLDIDISTGTTIFGDFSKTLFVNNSGDTRMSYFSGDTFIVTDLDN